jgi:hypothetical protein
MRTANRAKSNFLALPGLALVAVLFAPALGHAEKNIWAKGATHFGKECMPPKKSCTLAYVKSPDGRKAVVVRIKDETPSIELAQDTATYPLNPVDRDVPFVEMEILWSPDSSAVSFAWNNTGITSSSRIYKLTSNGPRAVDLSPVMDTLARAYPPCVAVHERCDLSKSGEDYNYLTVAWSAPHTAVLMGEVPPSSQFGANLGQMEGFEVDASLGKVIRVLTASQFKREWQRHMGWHFRVPDKP